MEIPLYSIAAVYFLLFLLWVILTLVNIYHVLRYAYWTKVPLVLTGVYMVFTVAVIALTGMLLRNVRWTDTVDLRISTPEINTPNPFSKDNANFDVLK